MTRINHILTVNQLSLRCDGDRFVFITNAVDEIVDVLKACYVLAISHAGGCVDIGSTKDDFALI